MFALDEDDSISEKLVAFVCEELGMGCDVSFISSASDNMSSFLGSCMPAQKESDRFTSSSEKSSSIKYLVFRRMHTCCKNVINNFISR